MAAVAKPKIHIVYYSMHGHIEKMAEAVAKGVTEAGADVQIFRVAETLPKEVLEKMHAAPGNPKHPVATPETLAEADGVLFGIPTRFGMAPAQVKALMDATGGLWGQGKLMGKPAGVFFSTATQGGGQETTALTFFTQLVHHGMVIVPIGYSCPLLFDLKEVHGGSPYGAGTLSAGDGSRQPSKLELDVAEHQGKYFTGVAAALKKGRA